MAFLSMLGRLVEGIISWFVGFLIAGFIFFFLIFYITPALTGISLDRDKYLTQTAKQIQYDVTHTYSGSEKEEAISLTESIIAEIDEAADNIITWINN